MKTRCLLPVFALAAVANAFCQNSNQITKIAPASAAQGTTLTVTFTLDSDAPPPPPAGVLPGSVKLGTLSGSSVTHSSQYLVTAQFTVPYSEATGWKDGTITFSTPNGTLTFSASQAFEVTAGNTPVAGFSATPTSGTAPLVVQFTDASSGSVTGRLWSFGDGSTSTGANPSHTFSGTGSYTVSLTVVNASGSNTLVRSSYITVLDPGMFPMVDTGQSKCYGASAEISAPAAGQSFYGQDAQCYGNQPGYSLSSDGLTVYDRNTGLTWQRSPDLNGDGTINASDKLTWTAAQARPAALNAAQFGGYSDWRLPTIKELYSLMDFRGTDPSGLSGTNTAGLTPFIDTAYFKFAYGDTGAGERIIDSQYASSSVYVAPDLMGEGGKLFGVNFADGRIKGYGLMVAGSAKTFFVQCVRGNPGYGINLFVDNGDQTIADLATGLMWTKGDSGAGMNWQDALAWVQTKNAARYLGYNDWRLPNAKELQGILDYTRSPDSSSSAAIDPVFSCTQITNENNQVDYPWYWAGTTHANYSGGGSSGVYICFGRSLGYMNSSWVDVHGAGAQRGDPKSGSLSSYTYAAPNGYYNSVAPQGDAVRIFNYVRLVRGGNETSIDHVGDGISDAWRRRYFGGSGMTASSSAAATADPDMDNWSNLEEYIADTNPTSAASVFQVQNVTFDGGFSVEFQSSAGRKYTLYRTTDLASGNWAAIPSQTNIPGTGGNQVLADPDPPAGNAFYSVDAQLR